LRAAVAQSNPGEPVFIDAGKVHPYLYPLFYGLGDIKTFQTTRQVRVEDGVFRVSRFGRFMFERDAVDRSQPFIFVTLATRLPCATPEILKSAGLWSAGRCAPG
jgi:hypothetical protein